MHILLVEPSYYSRYPPLGLLRLSAYHKSMNDTTELVRGCKLVSTKPDRVYVTSLFTWAWREVWEAVKYYKRLFPGVELWLGGLYASLLPEHAAMSGADHIYNGLFTDAEELMPDYSPLPSWNGSIIFASRGCPNDCPFCAVPILEGKLNSAKRSIRHLVWPIHTRIIFWDNNLLASPYWRDIFDELEELNRWIDFNQGLDARLISDEVAERLSKLKLMSGTNIKVRLGYDSSNNRRFVQKAVERLKGAGIKGRHIMVYILYNFNDDPDDFLERIRNVLEWGTIAYPMRYQPISGPYALKKDSYIAPSWDPVRLEMVQDARRVLGYGGAFPPYEGLLKKLNKAHNFHAAFSLRPLKRKNPDSLAS